MNEAVAGGSQSDSVSKRQNAGRPSKPRRRHPATRALYNRLRDRWDLMADLGKDPNWGTVLGLLYLEGVLTEGEASAGRLYAEAKGRYDRYFTTDRCTAKSPAYERGLGRDDELARHQGEGTVPSYERRARRAKRVWTRVQRHIPNDVARSIVEAVCIHNQEISSVHHTDFKTIMQRIAKEFFGGKGRQ